MGNQYAKRTLEERFIARGVNITCPRPDLGNCWEMNGYGDKNGYREFDVNGQGKGAHRVAWFLYYGYWSKESILHDCDNPPCVKITHLREGTPADNSKDMVLKGRSSTGEKHGMAVLTELQAKEIKETGQSLTQRELSEKYEVSQHAIGSILRGNNWKHLGGDTRTDITTRFTKGGPKGESSRWAKLTEAEVIEILHKSRNGVRGADLSRQYGVGSDTISKITTGKNWKKVYKSEYGG